MSIDAAIVKSVQKRIYTCSVPGCMSNSRDNPGLSYHTFPPPNGSVVKLYDYFGNYVVVDQQTAWKRVLKINNLKTSLRVCSLHFKKDDYLFPDIYYSKKRPLLIKTAVPSCNLTHETRLESEKSFCQEQGRLKKGKIYESLVLKGTNREVNMENLQGISNSGGGRRLENGFYIQATDNSNQCSGRIKSKRSAGDCGKNDQDEAIAKKIISECQSQSFNIKIRKTQNHQDLNISDVSSLHSDNTSKCIENKDQNEFQDETEEVYIKQEEEMETSDQEDDDYDSESEDERDLRKWIIESKIPHDQSDELLQILRRKKMPNLPASTKIFLLKDSHFFFDDVERLESEVLIGRKSDSEENEVSGDASNKHDRTSVFNPHPKEVTNVNCKTEFEVAVMHKLDQLNTEVRELAKDQKVCKVLLNDLIKCNSFQDFKEKHNIDIPIKTLDEFLQFSTKLLSDQSLKRDLCEEFKTCLDKHLSITRTFVGIMKKFMTKDVANRFTAVRESRDGKKIPFQQLEFCKCMYGFIRARRMMTLKIATNDGELRQALSEVFTNVKKWT